MLAVKEYEVHAGGTENATAQLAKMLWNTWRAIGVSKDILLRDLEQFQATYQVKDFIGAELDEFYKVYGWPSEGNFICP
jgi:hypothetical protein